MKNHEDKDLEHLKSYLEDYFNSQTSQKGSQ